MATYVKSHAWLSSVQVWGDAGEKTSGEAERLVLMAYVMVKWCFCISLRLCTETARVSPELTVCALACQLLVLEKAVASSCTVDE